MSVLAPIVSLTMLASGASSPRLLDPGLYANSQQLEAAFNRGFEDAERQRSWGPVWDRTRRGIGKIRVAPLREETVSFLWFPQRIQIAYVNGFEARKKYEPEDVVERQRKEAKAMAAFPNRFARVYCLICLYPSFGGPYGQISRLADINDLKDVRVVLQVGDEVFQPVRQPGDLQAQSGVGSSESLVPRTINEPDGTPIVVYSERITESYRWYSANFHVDFDLFNPDGTSRIPTGTESFSFRVIYGTNDREARFKLSELRDMIARLTRE